MTRSVLISATASLMFAAACASAQTTDRSADADARLAEFERTGETRACVQTYLIDEMEALDESRFLVEMRGGDFYLNEVNGRCAGAGRGGTALSYSTSITSLCRGEIIRVFDTGAEMTVGSCALGAFERLEPREE
ncbi:hypothetical protein DDZ18_12870 [Marinicauda salina]|uniref:DUF3617 family protein n=1 Tax=Marinicauda salina TaxID=2135793 RepID=A0A2U2BRN6_9PROT|nr:DUF6491 family protein [Marinicauda salina]PWE16649.1 hypothetical protein DDZ18_12870 [Marinicauda salina]